MVIATPSISLAALILFTMYQLHKTNGYKATLYKVVSIIKYGVFVRYNEILLALFILIIVSNPK